MQVKGFLEQEKKIFAKSVLNGVDIAVDTWYII